MRVRWWSYPYAAWWILAITTPARAQAPSEESLQFFQQNCASCHTIGGGRLTGPDLKDVENRKDRDWLIRFMLDPKASIDSGDAYARKLLEDSRGVLMAKIPTLTRDRAAKLLDLIAVESKLERSQFAGVPIDERPLTAADELLGEQLFLGRQRLKNRGPACISCHANHAIAGFGGGGLGPDLTQAFSRLEGRKALAAWLSAPPSPTMQPVYRQHPLDAGEILALVAYLKKSAESGVAAARPVTLLFILGAFIGAAAILLLFDAAWSRRFTSVRRRLVERA